MNQSDILATLSHPRLRLSDGQKCHPRTCVGFPLTRRAFGNDSEISARNAITEMRQTKL